MRAFFVLLIVANLAAWSMLVWQQHHGTPVVQNKEIFRFEQAADELQILDVARATVRKPPSPTPVSAEVTTIDEVVEDPIPSSFVEPELSGTSIESWCGISDELESRDPALAWLESWRNVGGEGRLIESEESVSSTWWVHLPPFKDEAQARVVLKELQEKSIDSFYMRTGELVGGISLGVFAIRDSAFLVKADMLKRGYKAEVKEIQKMATRIKLYAKLASRLSLGDHDVQALLKNSATISIDEIPCE